LNYLFHLALNYPELKSLVPGNFAFDLCNAQERRTLTAAAAEGARFHRAIDHFASQHPSILELNRNFHPTAGKYAPVASDIVADYLLFINWDKFFTNSYGEFAEWCYEQLSESKTILPQRVIGQVSEMINHRWLEVYTSLEGIEKVLKRTNSKLSFPGDLTTVVPTLVEKEILLGALVCEFFFDCIIERETWLSPQNGKKS
jgi:acyl carrier protein phosphodiesterase